MSILQLVKITLYKLAEFKTALYVFIATILFFFFPSALIPVLKLDSFRTGTSYILFATLLMLSAASLVVHVIYFICRQISTQWSLFNYKKQLRTQIPSLSIRQKEIIQYCLNNGDTAYLSIDDKDVIYLERCHILNRLTKVSHSELRFGFVVNPYVKMIFKNGQV